MVFGILYRNVKLDCNVLNCWVQWSFYFLILGVGLVFDSRGRCLQVAVLIHSRKTPEFWMLNLIGDRALYQVH